jgi:hypothetical protein
LPFLRLRKDFRIVKHPSHAAERPPERTRPEICVSTGVIMEETAQKSCWGITARAVIGFSGLLALAYLFGGI